MVRVKLAWDSPRRFRLRVTEVEVFQVSEDNLDAVAAWCRGTAKARVTNDGLVTRLYVPDNVGMSIAFVGDYVSKSSNGNFKVYKPDAFDAKYERVD